MRIFHPFAEKPPMDGGRLADVIKCAKFYLNQIRGFDSVGGRIVGFPIGTRCRRQHNYRSACDVKMTVPLNGLFKLHICDHCLFFLSVNYKKRILVT